MPVEENAYCCELELREFVLLCISSCKQEKIKTDRKMGNFSTKRN